jgi:hypothetical protein
MFSTDSGRRFHEAKTVKTISAHRILERNIVPRVMVVTIDGVGLTTGSTGF